MSHGKSRTFQRQNWITSRHKTTNPKPKPSPHNPPRIHHFPQLTMLRTCSKHLQRSATCRRAVSKTNHVQTGKVVISCRDFLLISDRHSSSTPISLHAISLHSCHDSYHIHGFGGNDHTWYAPQRNSCRCFSRSAIKVHCGRFCQHTCRSCITYNTTSIKVGKASTSSMQQWSRGTQSSVEQYTTRTLRYSGTRACLLLRDASNIQARERRLQFETCFSWCVLIWTIWLKYVDHSGRRILTYHLANHLYAKDPFSCSPETLEELCDTSRLGNSTAIGLGLGDGILRWTPAYVSHSSPYELPLLTNSEMTLPWVPSTRSLVKLCKH